MDRCWSKVAAGKPTAMAIDSCKGPATLVLKAWWRPQQQGGIAPFHAQAQLAVDLDPCVKVREYNQTPRRLLR